MAKRRKSRGRICRICKRSPVWIGGDVKDPGPVCKRCYHKHVWPDRKATTRATPGQDERTGGGQAGTCGHQGVPRPEKDAAATDETVPGRLFEDLAGVFRGLLTIPGVVGVGQPVMVLSPGDLPPEMLGFVERLRAGAIEHDEEMVLLTLSAAKGRRRRTHPALQRLRQAFALLVRYAIKEGVPIGDLEVLVEVMRQNLRPHPRPGKG